MTNIKACFDGVNHSTHLNMQWESTTSSYHTKACPIVGIFNCAKVIMRDSVADGISLMVAFCNVLPDCLSHCIKLV